MDKDDDTDHAVSGGPKSAQQQTGPTHEEGLAARLPVQEKEQPDPMLQLSVGRLGAGSMALAALACAIILAVVLYGLNSPVPSAQNPASPAAAPAASGPAPGAAKPPAKQSNNNSHS
jgi:hypothetical protein